MNRVAHRTTIALLLALALVCGMLLFVADFFLEGGDWAVFPGNPHVYTGGNIGCGVITDREGNVLLDATTGRVYSDDADLRLSTLHWLGDRDGYISAPAVSYYSNEMAGYDPINGLYSYSGTGGEAKMTLSAQAQRAALDALGDRKGTVAVYNYETGELLCAVSTPTYDPDDVPDIEGDETGAYEGAYLNRFTQVDYVPGSIFKIITAAAALELDENLAQMEFTCTASYEIQGDRVTCEGYHGTLNMEQALAKSCNCYFAQLMLYLGRDTMEKYVSQMQVFESVSFDGITTSSGHFDLSEAADVELAWAGIGQYTDLINPCRFLTMMGAIAGEGEAAQPHIVQEVSSGSRVSYAAKAESTGRLLSRKTAKTLAQMMRNAVRNSYGDWNFPEGLEVCAKSGTAQLDGKKPNATFAGFVSNTEYPLAFICVVENAGGGAQVCVPIVSSVLQACKAVLDGQ